MIEDLHKDYNTKHPENQVGKSKFFDFRPIWVIPVQKQSQDVCKCIYHENIDLICTALINFSRKKKLQEIADNIGKLTVIYSKKIVSGENVKIAIVGRLMTNSRHYNQTWKKK